jgi:hypothetical protein
MGGQWHRTSRRIHILYGKGNENHELGTGFFVHKIIISAVKRVDFVNDRMSYIILRGRWFHIVVLNVHTPTENKIADSFYYVGFEVFTAVTMKNAIFWDVMPCGSCENRRFGGT